MFAMDLAPRVAVGEKDIVLVSMLVHIVTVTDLSLLNYALNVSSADILSSASLQSPSHQFALDRVHILRLMSAIFILSLLFTTGFLLSVGMLVFIYVTVHLLGLVFGLQTGTTHSICALSIEWVLDAEVGLSELLTIRVSLNSGIKVAHLFLLFTDALM